MASRETDSVVVKLAHNLPDDESTSAQRDENGNGAAVGGTIRKTVDIKINEKVDFESFMLKEVILKGLKRAGYIRPSPIQLKAVPVGRIGVDMIVQAKAGTGKTCVFTVLALETVEPANPAPQVVILAPAREIALQITDTLKGIGHYMLETKENEFTGVREKKDGIKIETFIGGTALRLDKDKAKFQKCQIIVGTPGRVWQMVDENHLSLDAVRLFVLDEADKLMEQSYQENINSIYAHLPSGKQMVVTSATYPNELGEFLSRYMKTPKFVNLGESDVQLLGVKQYLLTSDLHENEDNAQPREKDYESWLEKKIEVVNRILSRVCYNQCLIFCSYQDKVETLAKTLLTAYKWPASFIASNLSQAQRTIVLRRLQNFQIRVLVSTDLTARGIDAENVNLVINFDLPYNPETYFHRIGRAGRFGGYGAAITLTFNRTEEMKFYAMAVQNNFQVKRLTAISDIPNNLAENEQYYQSLPEMAFPSDAEINRFAAWQEKTGKGKPQPRRNEKQTTPKPVPSISEMDEYTKLIGLVGPTERWSPVEFMWDGNAVSGFQTTRGNDGKRLEYSRDEMLNILKDNLSSLPSSRASLAAESRPDDQPESVNELRTATQTADTRKQYDDDGEGNNGTSSFQTTCGKDEKRFEYSRTEMLNIRKANQSSVPSSTAESRLEEKPKPVCELQMASRTMDKQDNGATVQTTCGKDGKRLEYSRNEMLDIRKNSGALVPSSGVKSCVEEKPKAVNEPQTATFKTTSGKDGERLEYSRDKMLNIRKDNQSPLPSSGASIAAKSHPEEKPKPVKKPKAAKQPVDIRKQYDGAISQVAQSPFYQFFGGCALKLQAATVEARQRVVKANKATQTDEISPPVTPSPSLLVRQPGWRPIGYSRDQMLEMWKTVASPDWSFKQRRYPWITVVEGNGLLVDRQFGEVPVQNTDGSCSVQGEDEEEEDDDVGTDIRELIALQKKALKEYGETMQLYRKCLKKCNK